MMERFRRGHDTPDPRTRSDAATSTTVSERDATRAPDVRDPDFDRDRDLDRDTATRERRFDRGHDRGTVVTPAAAGALDRDTMRSVRARQREEFGGMNWGSSFFGWLSAMGLAAILVAILSAAGASLAIGQNADDGDAGTIGLAGGIAMLVALAVAYFAGGYVAGRMSRFDGARQGFGVWIIALVVAVILAVAGAVLGAEYNVLERLDLPRIPIDEGDLATGGLIALAVGLVVTLLAAVAGGKAGERYHKRVDRVAVRD
jgi:hypothetical protein